MLFQASPADPYCGATLRPGDAGYDAARRALAWNQRLPDRFPAAITLANDVHDVVRAVRTARAEGLRVTVRSGGHSWAANHVRDGGLVIDVSRLRDLRLDVRGRLAMAGPGCAGHALDAALRPHGLFFPAGHCRGVCIGGYLLQGGFGWHGRTLGLACESVAGLDVVTADGSLVHASERENADLYWAARGAGPGFFGVVVRFHLRLHARPRVIGAAYRSYPADALPEVFRFLYGVGPHVSPKVELQAMMSRRVRGVRGPGVEIMAPVFADSLGDARAALEFLDAAPRSRQGVRSPFVPLPLTWMYREVMRHYPSRHRYAVDNMWMSADVEAVLPHLHALVEALPPAPSHALWLNWAPPQRTTDMAFSLEDAHYLALYGVWEHARDDARYASWAEDHMRAMAPLATGIQLADENLGHRPAPFVAQAHLDRLDTIRAARDPQQLFHTWMGRP